MMFKLWKGNSKRWSPELVVDYVEQAKQIFPAAAECSQRLMQIDGHSCRSYRKEYAG